MDLSEKWRWSKRKLLCRVRPETGNPAGDDLRERFAELAGADLNGLLTEMKLQKKKREEKDKGVSVDYDADKKFREMLGRSHVLGASRFALEEMAVAEHAAATTVTQKNLKKVFARIPESPPRRVLLEIQRERSKPLRLPDQDEMAAASAKLQKKLEKEYRKRRAALEASEREEEAKRRAAGGFEEAESTLMNLYATALPHYTSPDLFSSNGPYLGSMIYLSRNGETMNKSHRISGGTASGDDYEMGFLQAALLAAQKKQEEEEERARKAEEERMAALVSESSANDIGAKLYCAAALCNWSRNSANAARLAAEGGVRAIIQLSLESDPRITRFCAAAFRFMSDHSVLSLSMIDEGAVVTISDMVKSTGDEFIITNLCIALVNLTLVHGREASLVEGTIVLAFTNISAMRPELTALSARGLYNLTCVDNSYPLIDRVIRYLISLSSSNASNVKHICASALCNLSDLKQMRARLIEESICSALSTLCRNTPTRTRRVCAVILQNLSATKSCRVEMVIRSAVHVAHSLSHDSDPIILRCVGLTLARLSMEAANCQRIIHEYGITALSKIASKYPAVPGISQPVATAFQMLASRPGVRVQAVQEGCVTALAVLMRSSQDAFTLQNCIFALCQLLTEAENHLPIVQQGLLITLVALSQPQQTNDQVKHLCALALLNFSKSEDSHKHMVNAGCISAIIALAAGAPKTDVVSRRRCANALCNVSSYDAGRVRMVSDGIIPALVGLLRDDVQTIHYACTALCRLCSSVEYATNIVDAGAVPSLVQYALKGERETKQFCGSVLSALSQFASCRAMLCEMGCISALKSQSDLPDDVSQLRCLVAFANISCELSVQEQMVNEGVVEIIASLVANSYHEMNYSCCAKALCNLACSPATRLAVAKGGGVQALMLISMVHSVNKETKLLCVQALGNLLDDATVPFMLDEGLTTSLANLCKIDDPSHRVKHLCACMFNQLCRYQEAMFKIVEKPPVTSAIYAMAESEHPETAVTSCRTTANLLLCGGPVRQKAVANGALRVMEKGITLADQGAVAQCLAALLHAAQDTSFLQPIARSSLPLTLIGVAKAARGEMLSHAAKTLSMLAHGASSRPFLQTREHAAALIELICSDALSSQPHAAQWLALALQHMSNGFSDSLQLVQLGAAAALQYLHDLDCPPEVEAELALSAAETLRCLCGASEEAVAELASPSIVAILSRATAAASSNMPGADLKLSSAAGVMYSIASAGPKARIAVGTPECVETLCLLAKHSAGAEQTIAALFLFLNDPKTRYSFANEAVCRAIVSIFEFNKNVSCLLLFSSSPLLLFTPTHFTLRLCFFTTQHRTPACSTAFPPCTRCLGCPRAWSCSLAHQWDSTRNCCECLPWTTTSSRPTAPAPSRT